VKSRVIIALSLALVMLLTLAAPALAKPVTGTMTPFGGVSGTATYALSATHSDNLKVNIVLKGVAQVQYQVWIVDSDGNEISVGDNFWANARGIARFTAVTTQAFSNSDSPFKIRVGQVGVGAKFWVDSVAVTFS
jgi:hypothetical protein